MSRIFNISSLGNSGLVSARESLLVNILTTIFCNIVNDFKSEERETVAILVIIMCSGTMKEVEWCGGVTQY